MARLGKAIIKRGEPMKKKDSPPLQGREKIERVANTTSSETKNPPVARSVMYWRNQRSHSLQIPNRILPRSCWRKSVGVEVQSNENYLIVHFREETKL